MLNNNQIKELAHLQTLIDSHPYRDFYYHDYLDNTDNLRVKKSTKGPNEAENFFMTDNIESSELDWWILYVAYILRVSDADSIYKTLSAVKKLHPELYYTVNDPRIVQRRLNILVKSGFLIRMQYVKNTTTNVSEAEEIYNKKCQLDEERKEILKAPVSLSVDSDYLDEEDENTLELVNYNNAEYEARFNALRLKSNVVRGSETFQNNIIGVYYGKDAKLVTLYTCSFLSFQWLVTRFGSTMFNNIGNVLMYLPFKQIGLACVGSVVSQLSTLSSFYEFKPAKVNSRLNGIYVIPAELEFRTKTTAGDIFTYNCGVFYNYYFPGKGKLLPKHMKQNMHELLLQIKNYIGVRGLCGNDSKKSDGFVIICVNDMVDIDKFLHSVKKHRTRDSYKYMFSEAEMNRIFFTNEGIAKSDVGVRNVIGFRMDENEELGYELYPVTLPIS